MKTTYILVFALFLVLLGGGAWGAPTHTAKFEIPNSSLLTVAPSPYLANLLESFEFIDFYDELVAMAVGNSTPWTRYDEPGKQPSIEKWRAAKSVNLADPKRTSVEILHDMISEIHEGFRNHPVIGGGDEKVDGPDVQGFYIATLATQKALEQNPYLTLTVRPSSVLLNGAATVYIKHEYPSARTFRKFEALLSAPLKQELIAAETAGTLKDVDSADFKRLTPKVIDDLIRKVLNDKTVAATARYQRILSIHPFGDYNGRTGRMWYQRETGKPLFLEVWDWDLFLSESDFAEAVNLGDHQLNWIRQSFLNEQLLHPGFPDFFKAPGAWQVAALIDSPSVDANAVRDVVFNLFNDLSLKQAVQHKSSLEVRRRIDEAVQGL